MLRWLSGSAIRLVFFCLICGSKGSFYTYSSSTMFVMNVFSSLGASPLWLLMLVFGAWAIGFIIKTVSSS